MKVLLVHPSGLMYTEVYLRLEPLGLERVAAACRTAGHDVRLLDLQVFRHRHFQRLLATWRPDAVGFSLNYLANIPEVVDLALMTRRLLPDTLVFVGGHSASFTAREILGPCRRRDRLRRPGRGRGDRVPHPRRLGGLPGARHAAGRRHGHRRGAAAAHDRNRSTRRCPRATW